MSIQRSLIGALIALVLTFSAAYIGSRFTVGEWYADLSKPSWNPPNWLFGPGLDGPIFVNGNFRLVGMEKGRFPGSSRPIDYFPGTACFECRLVMALFRIA